SCQDPKQNASTEFYSVEALRDAKV
ncbi:unnamed protein product, partial [Leptidea sinapis]